MSLKLNNLTSVVIPLALLGGMAFGSTALAATGSDNAMSSKSSVTNNTSSAGAQTSEDYADGQNSTPEKKAGDSTVDNSMSTDNEMSTDQQSDKGSQTGDEYEEGGNQSGENGM